MDEYEYGVFQASNSGRIGNLRPQYGLNKPSSKRTLDTGNNMCVKSMGSKEKATFELALSLINLILTKRTPFVSNTILTLYIVVLTECYCQ